MTSHSSISHLLRAAILFALPAAFSASPARAASAVLQDVQVNGPQVILKLSRPVGYRAGRKAAAVILTLDDTEVSSVVREKAVVGRFVAGIEALPVTQDNVQAARVVVKLDRARDFTTVWAGSDLVLQIKEPAAPERRAPAAPAPPAAKPPAAAGPAQPAAPEAPAAATPIWRLRGKLEGSDGKPLDGAFAVAFRLKDAASKDAWSEWLQVKASSGVFHTALGRTNPLPESVEGLKLGAESDAGKVTIPPFRLQLASFPSEEEAKKLKAEVEGKLGSPEIRAVQVGGKKFYRVQLGPTDRASAQALFDQAAALGRKGLLIQD